MNELKLRLQKLENLSIDGIVLFNYSVHDPNFFYFTNSEINGTLFYDFSEPKLFVSEMELKQAKKSWVSDVIKIEKFEEIEKHISGRIGINGNCVSFNGYQKIKKLFKPIDISKKLEEIRSIKTPYEISQITKACDATVKTYKKVLPEISKSITEQELKIIIDQRISTNAFPTIVATGKNIAEPHHIPDNTKLGETVLMDFGAKHNGYCSDFTRTIGSKYERVIAKVMQKTEEAIKPGVKARDIDALARKTLDKNQKFFITSLGHGLGVEIHEKPWISKNSEDIFSTNMAFTIEPGLYVKNGIRTENTYVATKTGVKNLTAA
jgi:Xaa-Pro aminopeptidase